MKGVVRSILFFSTMLVADTPVTIRIGNELCGQEKAFCAQRLPRIKQSLEQLMGVTIADTAVPRIGLLCSGGGYRAMLYATGGLCALSDLALIDTLLYTAVLSGSTWALATWICSGNSIRNFHDWLIQRLGWDLHTIAHSDIALAAQVLYTKYRMGQPLGIFDVYGACVANDIFDYFTEDKLNVHLSDQQHCIVDGRMPMPLYTAIDGDSVTTEGNWYEFTPYEIGGAWLGMYVPTTCFGSKFQQGVLQGAAFEQPLSSLLGTFGLAIGITFGEFIQDMDLGSTTGFSFLNMLMYKLLGSFNTERPIYAQYNNFTAGIPKSPLAQESLLKMVDAGLNCNIPYSPLSGHRSERLMDILIILDASAGPVGGELKKVELYARENNLPFPQINYAEVGQHAFTLFNDYTSGVPVVLYIPCVVDEVLLAQYKEDPIIGPLYPYLHKFDIEECINDEYCNTFNFFYSTKQARRVTALAECNVHLAYPAFFEALKWVIDNKK